MKKYTDTELLETLLPILNYSIITRVDAVSVLDTVDFRILESNDFVSKSFVVALQNRINELANKTKVEVTNIAVDKAEDMCEDVVCEDTECVGEDVMRCEITKSTSTKKQACRVNKCKDFEFNPGEIK